MVLLPEARVLAGIALEPVKEYAPLTSVCGEEV